MQNFYITCTDIWANEWSDPIFYEWNGIDPSMFFNDDGRVYIQGQWVLGDRSKQPTGTTMQAELDIKTGKLISEPKEIWGGFAKHDTEGPHTYKKDGYYYLLVAEGGTFEHHLLSMARSKDIWGPYESYEQNPVLTADGKDEYIQNTGHGDLFQDPQGLWWAAVLAVRLGPNGRFPLSRETFLTSVDWPEGGWPSFRQPKMTMLREDSQVLKLPPLEYASKLGTNLLYIRDHASENYEISKINTKGLSIAVLASQSDLSVPFGTASFVGQRQRKFDNVYSATLLRSEISKNNDLRAGIAVYKDQVRFAEISYSYETSEVVLSWLRQSTGLPIVTRQPAKLDKSIRFKIEASEMQYDFLYCLEDGDWLKLGSMDSIEMSACDFTGPIFGVFASGQKGIKTIFESIVLE
jgi:beta-xylosidase